MINGFQIFAKFLVALITIGLAAAVIKFLLGWELIRDSIRSLWRLATSPASDARHQSHWLYLLRAARRLSDGAPADPLV